jgi:hypothetical protein
MSSYRSTQIVPKTLIGCIYIRFFPSNFIYTFYNDCRKQYLKKYYYKHPSTFKLVHLLSIENITELCKLGKFM